MVTLKFRLGVTQLANLCTLCTLLKSKYPGGGAIVLPLIVWVRSVPESKLWKKTIGVQLG